MSYDYNPFEDEPPDRDRPDYCSFEDVDEIDEDGDPHYVNCDRLARFRVLRLSQTGNDAQYACREHLGDVCEFQGLDAECTVTDLRADEFMNEYVKVAAVTDGGWEPDEEPF